jgi:hypothetical protein
MNGVANSQAQAIGGSGTSTATSQSAGDLSRLVVASATGEVGSSVYANTQSTFGGYVSGLPNLNGGSNGVQAFSFADGAPSAGAVDYILATHPNVKASIEAGSLQALGTGAMGANVAYLPSASHSYTASTEYTFTLAGTSGLVVGLLDFTGYDGGLPMAIDFNVSNFGATLLSQSFTTLASASAYFTDHALSLGNFSGNVDLMLSFTLTGMNAQGADFSYLVASGVLTNPVPEPSEWALLLVGLGVLGALARMGRARQL